MTALVFKASVRLLPTELGGRRAAIHSGYRPDWNVGNRWHGKPTINGGQVLLDGVWELAPGSEAVARIEPLTPELWGNVGAGSCLAMHEGPHVVGSAIVLEVVSRPEHFTPEVGAFYVQAFQFCDFVERAAEYPLPVRLRLARQLLLRLYETATELPPVEPPDGVDAGPSPATPTGWQGFEKFEFYWEIFDPYEEGKPVGGMLSDDLVEVYQDVKRGLDLWERDVPKAAAVWEWRFHFETHWGNHAIDALRALHRACLEAGGAEVQGR